MVPASRAELRASLPRFDAVQVPLGSRYPLSSPQSYERSTENNRFRSRRYNQRSRANYLNLINNDRGAPFIRQVCCRLFEVSFIERGSRGGLVCDIVAI